MRIPFTPESLSIEAPDFLAAASIQRHSSEITVTVPISAKDYSFFEDHIFSSMMIMPMTVVVEFLTQVLRLTFPFLRVYSLLNLKVLSPIILDDSISTLRFRIKIVSHTTEIALLDVELWIKDSVKYKCSAELTAAGNNFAEPAIPNIERPVNSHIDVLPEVSEIYSKWFFHGRSFQRIQSVTSLKQSTITGIVKSSCISDFKRAAKPSRDCAWLVDPLLLDAAMQLCAVWLRSKHNTVALPLGIGKVFVLNAPRPNVDHFVFGSVLVSGENVRSDVIVYDSHRPCIIVRALTGKSQPEHIKLWRNLLSSELPP